MLLGAVGSWDKLYNCRSMEEVGVGRHLRECQYAKYSM